MHLLFSYGTLQSKKIQLDLFGRTLTGTPDTVEGYRLGKLKIIDADVILENETDYYLIAEISNNTNDQIEGVLFEISQEELEQADVYEGMDYKRIKTTFISGKKGWIYIANN